jgi:hypothetical protein
MSLHVNSREQLPALGLKGKGREQLPEFQERVGIEEFCQNLLFG